MDKFWNCWVEGTQGGSHVKHPSLGEALKEAGRLARKNQGRRVYVMELSVYCEVSEAPVVFFCVD